jgi:hypothetical protein
MKTVKNNINEVRRVKDNEAEGMVRSGSWKYCPKSEWKATQTDRKTEVSKPSKKKKKDPAVTESKS